MGRASADCNAESTSIVKKKLFYFQEAGMVWHVLKLKI